MTHAVLFLLFALHDPDPELPPIEDFAGMPTWEDAVEQKRAWEECLEWLENAVHAWPDRRELFWHYMAICRHNIAVWQGGKDVANEDQCLDSRRRSLEDLRTMLGDEAYMRREFPRMPPRGPDLRTPVTMSRPRTEGKS